MAYIIFTQLFLAESLYANHDYSLAVVEYKRAFFYDASLWKDQKMRLHYTISVIHSDYVKGYEETMRFLNDFPSLDTDSKIILAKGLIKSQNYHLAIEILSQTQEKRLLGFSYFCNRQYRNAYQIWKEVDKALAMEIEKFDFRPKKSITRAMLLSAILPGSGEIYAGNIKQGLNGFIITSLSGFFLYNSIKQKKYVDAGLIFSLLFNRFYLGSISNAGRFAQNYNKKKEEKWRAYIKDKYFSGDSLFNPAQN